ncbi:MAG: AAA family ATPase, partial [Candidatus Methanomethylophilaceae archaeon]|nr:AAA family ATPase [Candidatus Methanomethylophilaceae archaeon]
MNGKLARVDYVTVLESFKDTNDVVKVLTGMRRCGKTSILEQYIDSLRDSGVSEEDIFYLDF